VTGDWQTLAISGTVSADVTNDGGGSAGAFTVTFFEDVDRNRVFGAGVDTVLGSAEVSGLGPGQTTPVESTASGTVVFREDLIYAFVDSAEVIAEPDETDNTLDSGTSCHFTAASTLQPVVKWIHPVNGGAADLHDGLLGSRRSDRRAGGG
jgi:hypothetical protein